MSFAYLQLYTGDYIRDTRHLTPQKHGVYLLLLMHCWDQRSPLPLDEQECAGIANCRSADEVESLRYVLNRYFVKMVDGFYNLRMQKEIARAAFTSDKRSGAAKRGVELRRKQREIEQLLSNSTANAKHDLVSPAPSPSPSTPKKQGSFSIDLSVVESCKTSNILCDEKPFLALAREILSFLNEKTGKTFRDLPANTDLICNRLKEGITLQECKSLIAKKVRDWKGDDKMNAYLRPKTLFNKTNFANYLGELNVKVP
jgi:uncharacterized phage protein (TIGR02220 family)